MTLENLLLIIFNLFVGLSAIIQVNSSTVLLMILSKIFEIKINEQIESMRKKTKIIQICKQVLEIRDSIDVINRLMGSIVFIKIIINGIYMSSSFCALADNFNRNSLNYYIIFSLILTTISCNIDLLCICLSSKRIIDCMQVLCNATESRISSEEFMTTADEQKFYLILSLKNRIDLNAIQVFDVSFRTYLYVINTTATCAIILIRKD